MIIYYTIISTLLIVIITLCFVVWNISNKNEIYEAWIENFSKRANNAYLSMKSIDNKQMFEKDDDVGVVFEEIKMLIEDLNNKLGEEYDENDGE
jgi:hypothetical protein